MIGDLGLTADMGGIEKQVPVAHEFGHMTGCNDEYRDASGDPWFQCQPDDGYRQLRTAAGPCYTPRP